MTFGSLAIQYYKMGIYTAEDLKGFVTAGYLTPEEYKETTGVDFQPDKTVVA